MNKSILTNKTILIVDDYAVNRELLSMFVSDSGAVALTASNGLECLNIVKSQQVDMILMDSNMPVMNGIDATREIRLLPEGKNIVIVGISVSVDENEDSLCFQSGMDHLQDKLTLNEEVLIKIGNLFFTGDRQRSETNSADKPLSQNCSAAPSPCNYSDESLVINYQQALNEFENDEDLLISLITEFNSVITAQQSMMTSALINDDFEYIQKEAHGIKGGAANLCALPLSEAAGSLEMACRQKRGKMVISELLDSTSTQIHRFNTYVSQLQSAQ